jgi:hypothetical protein
VPSAVPTFYSLCLTLALQPFAQTLGCKCYLQADVPWFSLAHPLPCTPVQDSLDIQACLKLNEPDSSPPAFPPTPKPPLCSTHFSSRQTICSVVQRKTWTPSLTPLLNPILLPGVTTWGPAPKSHPQTASFQLPPSSPGL